MENNDKTKWINIVLDQMSRLDETSAKSAIEKCGRECLKSSGVLEKIQELRDEVADKDDSDLMFDRYKEKMYQNSPRLYKKDEDFYLEYHKCSCGMVTGGGVTDPFLCNCTIGYTKEIFETLFGRPVEVELIKSILNKDEICLQKISLSE